MLLAAPLLRLAAPGSCNLGSCAPRRRLAPPAYSRNLAMLLFCRDARRPIAPAARRRATQAVLPARRATLSARPSLIGCNPLSLACSLQTRHALPLNSPPRPSVCAEFQDPALVIRLCLAEFAAGMPSRKRGSLSAVRPRSNTASNVEKRSLVDEAKVSMRRCAGPIKCQGPTLVGAPFFRSSGGFPRRLYFRNSPRTCLAQVECETSVLALYRVRKSNRGREWRRVRRRVFWKGERRRLPAASARSSPRFPSHKQFFRIYTLMSYIQLCRAHPWQQCRRSVARAGPPLSSQLAPSSDACRSIRPRPLPSYPNFSDTSSDGGSDSESDVSVRRLWHEYSLRPLLR